ncbi:MAG: L-threonylcarbamoyladenylate synthase [Anaerolineae bacterium]
MRTEVIHVGNENAQHRAVEVLKGGGLVAFSTDTVYGLAALPWNLDALAHLLEAKQRRPDKPIPLLLSDADQLDRVATIPRRFRRQARRLITHFWPGGLTLVLPKTEIVPSLISPNHTVGVRVPNLLLSRMIIQSAGGVLAVTSANISGQLSPITAQEVKEQLGGRIELILDDGPTLGGIPSSVLDCTVSPPSLLRHGAVTEVALCAVIGSIQAG